MKKALIPSFIFTFVFVALGTPAAFAHAQMNTSSAHPAHAAHAHLLYNVPNSANSQIAQNLSRNWAGYVADTGIYTSVTGTWTVPNVSTSSNSAEADATWVGIGGVKDENLIQAGTQAITENGQIAYQAWYETLPNASTPVSLTVNPGDSVTTTLTETSTNEWLVTIRDNTTGETYSNTLNYSSDNSSAEWIEEMPSDTSGQFVPLDNFGSVAFSSASATIDPNGVLADGISENLLSLGTRTLTMTTQNDGTTLATPSSLGADDASFTVTRTSASSNESAPSVNMRSGFTRGGEGVQGFQGFDPFAAFGQVGQGQFGQFSQAAQAAQAQIDQEIAQLESQSASGQSSFSTNPGAYTATSSTYTTADGQTVHVVQYSLNPGATIQVNFGGF
jgi:hypothetical protein